ncbi:MAG: IS4 family transposase [Microcystaceae cyanobacterium]
MSWIDEELKTVDLGDKRRARRLGRILEDLTAQPEASVPQASRDNASMQGTYEFWANVRIKAQEILQPHIEATIERIKEHPIVLAIQDTTELDFGKTQRIRKLGSLGHGEAKGLKVHTVLCSTADGLPLGVLHQKTWTRENPRQGKGDQRRKQAIAEKESHRWLECLKVTQELVPPETKVVTVGDREADIFELFATPRRSGSELLIRAAQNRNVKVKADTGEEELLFEALRKAPISGQVTLELQRTPRRKARAATLTVRWIKVELQPPTQHPQRKKLTGVRVWAILASEENPPIRETPVSWLLLTTLSVNNFSGACECLRKYSKRWAIERFHYVLKSGCHLEELQLEEAQRIEKALATYCIVAWRLLWLTYQARVNPQQAATVALEKAEWQALYCMIKKTPMPPAEPPTISECIRWIASLGGFLGRKCDGEPGVKTLWRGWQRLNDIALTWQLLTEALKESSLGEQMKE